MEKLLCFIKKNKIECIIIVVMVIFAFIILNKKEYMFAACKVCGKATNCYKVTYHAIKDKHKESYYVCSKECEDFLDNLMIRYGGAKE